MYRRNSAQVVVSAVAILILSAGTPRPVAASPETQAEAMNRAGTDLMKAKKFADAARKFRAASELDPAWGVPYVNLCNALFGDGQVDASLAACRDALKHGLTYEQRVVAFALVERIWASKGKPAVPSTASLQCTAKAAGAMANMPPASKAYEAFEPDGSKAVFCARTERISTSNYIRPGDTQTEVTPARGPDGSLTIHGPYNVYYPKGEKKEEGYFDGGQRSGKSVAYYRSGAVESISDVDRADGGRDCTVRKDFYETGEKMGESRGWGCRKDPGTISTWYVDGAKKRLVSRSSFCAKASVINFHMNGQKESQGCGVEQKEGEWKYFDAAGNALRVEHYVDGRLSGEFTRFSKGVVVELGTYDRGLKHGQWRTWDESRKLLSDDEFRDDAKLTGKELADAQRERKRGERQHASDESRDQDSADRAEKLQSAANAKDAKCNVDANTVEAVADFFGDIEVGGQPAPVSIGTYGAGRNQVLIAISSFGRLTPALASQVASRFLRARSGQRGLGITFANFRTQCSRSNGLFHIVKAKTSR